VLATLNRFLTLSRPPLPAKALGVSRSHSKTAPRKGFLPIGSFLSSHLLNEMGLQKDFFMNGLPEAAPQLRNVRTPDAKRSAGMQIRTPAIDFKESQSTSLYG